MKRFIVPLILCAASVLLLIAAFPHWHSAARWGFVFNRGEAIERARQIAAQQGFAVDGSQVRVGSEINRELETYRRWHPDDARAQRISPVIVKIVFSSPVQRPFEVQLFPDGRVAGWQLGGSDPPPTRVAGRPPSTPLIHGRAKAQEAFQLLTAPDSQAFRLTTDGAASKEGLRYSWEPGMSEGGFQPTIDIAVRRGRVVHAETHASFIQSFDDEYQRQGRTTAPWKIGFFVLIFVMILGASVLYTLGGLRKKAPHRLALAFGLVNTLLAAAAFFSGPKIANIAIAELIDGNASSGILYGVYMSFVGAGSMAWVFFGGGLSAAGATLPKWWSLRLLFSRRLLSRPVGLSLCAGLLWAPVLMATQALVAMAFPRNIWSDKDAGELLVRFPTLPGLLEFPLHPTLLGFFGVAVAFALTRVPSLRWRGLLLLGMGAAFFSGYENRWDTLPAIALSGILTAAALTGIYRSFDLLAMLVAETARNVVITAAVLLSQPSHSLHALGWRGILLLGTALAAGWVLIHRGADPVNEEEAATRPLAEGIQAKRDELKSEFNIAQRAQRQMLPDSAPPVPGFTIAAHCTPARDVGGDLYDFLPLPAGRLGIAVADVSGKGVPAALYMTLTKGLLAATSQEDLELSTMLEHVNAHLYTVGRRKTFVTMALAILDPAAKTLEYARAGHNPIVWRKALDGSTTLVASRGMGLGITGGKVFVRTLTVETLLLEPGDFVVFYSDGLTEAMNENLEQFGDDRLLESVASLGSGLGSMSASQARDAILGDVTRFLAGTHPQDDLTLVVLKFD